MIHTSLLRRAVAAIFVVFLHYVPQITLYMDDGERYFGRWGLGNVARIAVGVLLLAGAALAVGGVIRRWAPAWALRLFHHLFLVALLSGVLAALVKDPSENQKAVAAAWGFGLTVIAGSLFWRNSRLVHYAGIFCLIFSPLVPILFAEMLFWPRWDEPLDPLPTYSPRSTVASLDSGSSVFIFVFDEWSWPRSNRDGQFTADFPHLQALSKDATVYRHALSPFRETGQSLPRFIFQTDQEFKIHDGRTWFLSPRPYSGEGPGVRAAGETETPTQDCPSLLQAARTARYRTYLLGFHHAYRHVLGKQVDVCRSYFAGDEAGLAEKLVDELLENTRSWSDPLSRNYVAPLADRLDVKNWRAMVHRYRDDMFRVLAECPRRSLIVCHVPVPHAPFVFNADGSDHPADATVEDDNLEGYLRHLGYVDTLVGQIVDTLRQTKRYDDSLVIITSDHSWRVDSDPAYRQGPDWNLRVPLVVKLPGQKASQVVNEPFPTNRLMPVLESVCQPR